jgi:hypothetical protein
VVQGVQGIQNVPCSAWVKTDDAADVSQQTSRLPLCWQRRFLPTRKRYILYLLYPLVIPSDRLIVQSNPDKCTECVTIV